MPFIRRYETQMCARRLATRASQNRVSNSSSLLSHSIAFLITKMGYMYMFDILTGSALYRARISQDTIFVTCPTSTGAVLGMTARKGQLLSISMNKETIVPYIVQTLRDTGLALALSGRLGLPGAEDLYKMELEQLLATGKIVEAAKLAGRSGGALRTPEVIARFQQIPAQPGQPQPVFLYFSTLLETGMLNEQEVRSVRRA